MQLDDDEYTETREDTLEQLREFDLQLKKMLDGDMTLVSELGQLKLAIEAAIKSAFQTPEVIRMFARREPAALRARLAALQQENKLGRLADSAFKPQAVEIIVALKRLGEELTGEEKHFLDTNTDVRKQFEAADKAIGEATVLQMASKGAAGGLARSASGKD